MKMKKFETPILMIEGFNAENILTDSAVAAKKSAADLANNDVSDLIEIFTIKLNG